MCQFLLVILAVRCNSVQFKKKSNNNNNNNKNSQTNEMPCPKKKLSLK